jgi:hypothetical protein
VVRIGARGRRGIERGLVVAHVRSDDRWGHRSLNNAILGLKQ